MIKLSILFLGIFSSHLYAQDWGCNMAEIANEVHLGFKHDGTEVKGHLGYSQDKEQAVRSAYGECRKYHEICSLQECKEEDKNKTLAPPDRGELKTLLFETETNVLRYENNEIICYVLSKNGVSCKWK